MNRAANYFILKDYDAAWGDLQALKAAGGSIHPDFIKQLEEASNQNPLRDIQSTGSTQLVVKAAAKEPITSTITLPPGSEVTTAPPEPLREPATKPGT